MKPIDNFLSLSLFKNEILDTFVFNIPHSSTFIPDRTGYVNKDLITQELSKLTDFATYDIFNVYEIEKIVAGFSRVFCDVERFADDNKEKMSKVGRGFFYTHTDDNKLLRENTNNIREKIFEEYYLPYHKKLTDKIVRILNTYNVAHIVDCHSFNDEPLESDTDKSLPRPDICLGTDDYHTPQYLIDFFKNGFENVGFNVAINTPYKGTIVPERFYKKDKKVKSIMIEINKKLYMEGGNINVKKVLFLNSVLRQIFDF